MRITRRWSLVLVALLIALGGVGCESTTTTDSDAESGTSAPAEERLYPNRPDAQEKDQERRIGETATVGGIAATVTSAEFRQSLNEFETAGYLVVAVSLSNTDDETHPYNTFDWRLQTPSGQVIDPGFTSEQDLGSGDLVAGGSTSGNVVFEVGSAKGDFYIIYKPGLVDPARGIWQATIQ